MFTLSDNYLQRLIESSPDIIVAVDRAGTIIYYNDGARRVLQYNSAEIIGDKVTRIYPSLDEAKRVMKAMRESADDGRISNFETIFIGKDRQAIPVFISGSIIRDDTGVEVGSIGYARDIRRMRQREQLATAGEIAVSLGHEINNPLESITNNLELLSRSLESHLNQVEFAAEKSRLEAIRSGMKRVQGIVQRLDEMTRKGVYETRDYMAGKRMADLTPRETAKDRAPVVQNGTAHTAAIGGLAVLVVDDDTSVLDSLADLLKSEHCIPYTANRPSAALGILRNVKIDVIISDVVMPEMDGYEFYMKVKEEMPGLPVILMTAYYYDKDHIIKRSRLRGLEGAIFKKPVNPVKLRQLLSDLRSAHRSDRPATRP